MFFTIILRNPKGLEAAINMAAMFLHFQKQKEYIISLTKNSIIELEKTGEENFNLKMIQSGIIIKPLSCQDLPLTAK
jgi:hypothetical protein